MGTYDVLMLLVVLVAAFMGWQKGMAWQVASIAAIVGSYFAAMQFRDVVSTHINLPPPMNTFAAMLVIYLGCSMLIWLLFRVVRQSIEQMKLRDFDRQMGALVGAAKGGLIACLITLFAVALLPEQQTQAIIGSKSGLFIARFLNQAKPIMPDEVQQVLGPQLEKLEQGPGMNPYGAPENPYAQPFPSQAYPTQPGNAYPPTAQQPTWPPTSPPSSGNPQPYGQPQYRPPTTNGGSQWPPQNSANPSVNPDEWR